MSCAAIQQSDEMFCAVCRLRWDVNDREPPICPRDGKQAPASGRDESYVAAEDDRPFVVGDQVQKVRGSYSFRGEIRSVFTNKDGDVRYVVEHSTERGMLHIYSARDLTRR